jgi:hypothetical protein
VSCTSEEMHCITHRHHEYTATSTNYLGCCKATAWIRHGFGNGPRIVGCVTGLAMWCIDS